MTNSPNGVGPRIVGAPFFTSSPFEPTLPPLEKLEDIDLIDPQIYLEGDPHWAWKRLREEAPVFWHEKGGAGTEGAGFWVVTRYEDVQVVLKNSQTYSSQAGNMIDVPSALLGDAIPYMDPPRHTQFRRVVQRYFTPRAVAEWESVVRDVVNGTLDEIAERGECDFASEVALRLPVPATAEFFGLTSDQFGAIERVQEALHAAGTAEALLDYT